MCPVDPLSSECQVPGNRRGRQKGTKRRVAGSRLRVRFAVTVCGHTFGPYKLTYPHMWLICVFLGVVKCERAGESALPVAMR